VRGSTARTKKSGNLWISTSTLAETVSAFEKLFYPEKHRSLLLRKQGSAQNNFLKIHFL